MKKVYSILSILLICIPVLCAQQLRVKGLVTDEAGEPLPGVNVFVKGTTSGVTTNLGGEYSINIPNKDVILVYSFVGYNVQEVTVGDRTEINITLDPSVTKIDEVVVVGYGSQRKVSVTGAISTVNNQELQQSPTSSVTNSLSGRIPGLMSRQESGRPGGDAAKLFVRGRGTPNNNDPLVLVDGIERDFSQIPPDDIESVSLLKDASATAVYGVRGANGVLLVTTKRGNEGKTNISVSAEYGITKLNRLPQKVDAAMHAILKNEGALNEGKQMEFTEEDIYLYGSGESPFTHPNMDFIDIFTKNGTQQKYNVNVTGGSKIIKYFVSAGYFYQTGIFETDIDKLKKHPVLQELMSLSPAVEEALYKPDYNADYYFKRFNIRANVDVSLTEDIQLGIDLALRNEIQNRPAGLDSESSRVFGNMVRTPAGNFPLMNENGTFAAAPNIVRGNPLHVNVYSGFVRPNKSFLESTLKFKYDMKKLVHGLVLNAKFSYDSNYTAQRSLSQTEPVYEYFPATGVYVRRLEQSLPANGASWSGATRKTYGEVSLNYSRVFAERHRFTAMVLGNINSNQAPGSIEYGNVPQIYQGFVGRTTYSYDDRYLFEVNAGYNGSNRFAEGHRYALFPAASAGWVITNESFLKDHEIISFLKLRASYGEVGNDKLGDNFTYYYNSTYVDGSSYNFGVTPTSASGKREGQIGNKDITWERARKTNVGVETKWFNNQLTLNSDVFYDYRDDILQTTAQYALVAGYYSLPPKNYAIVENKGYELELGWNDQIGDDFQYNLRGTWTYARNKYKKYDETANPYDHMNKVGKPVGQLFGYEALGLFQTYEEIASSPSQFGTLQPGDIKYRDVNGDGIINDYDWLPIGYNPVPEITYSARLGCSYKGFYLNVMFQGVSNASVLISNEAAYEFFNLATAMDYHMGRWTPETAASATYHRLANEGISSNNNYMNSSYYMKDASYLRLKNMEIGYDFPKKWLEKIFVGSVRLYFTGYNLYTWDSLGSVDPESPNSTNGYFYPQQKIFNFGLNLTF